MEKQCHCEGDILCGINQPKDANALTDLEKKHTPVIEVPDTVSKDQPFEIGVVIGGIDGVNHPNEAGHFIEWIELYIGETYIARACYSGGASFPVAKFKVQLTHACGSIRVVAKCNLHGMWEGSREVVLQ